MQTVELRRGGDVAEARHEPAEVFARPDPVGDGPAVSPARDPERWLVAAAGAWIVIALLDRALPLVGGPILLGGATLWIATLCTPLALIALVALVRARRRPARDAAQSLAGLRDEAGRIDTIIADTAARIDRNRSALAEQARLLAEIGHDAETRLAGLGSAMRRENDMLQGEAERLQASAADARAQMEALLTDLPRAGAQLRAMADQLREAGAGVGDRTAALEGQLALLTARAREAEDGAGLAAQRLGDGLARLDRQEAAISERFSAVGQHLHQQAAAALAATEQALDAARRGIDENGAAIEALAARTAISFESVAAEAGNTLHARLEGASDQLAKIGSGIAGHSADATRFLTTTAERIEALDARIGDLRARAQAGVDGLRDGVDGLAQQAIGIAGTLADSGGAAHALADDAASTRAEIEAAAGELRDALPAALAALEELAHAGRATLSAALPQATKLEKAVRAVSATLAESASSLAAQEVAIEALDATASLRIAAFEGHAQAASRAVGDAARDMSSLAEEGGPRLVEALLRVRDTAGSAADTARTTLSAVIPQASDALAASVADALGKTLTASVGARVHDLSAAAEAAVKGAQAAAEDLARHTRAIADMAGAIEARASEARSELQSEEEHAIGRRSARLIDALNSLAIDIAQALSGDIGDEAWDAYLRGDRSMFVRRTVRLIDSGSAREIARHYQDDADFKRAVNRYIHDFEAMLRQVLGARDGNALAITLLSSDTGKLYVALAQAIERLRK